MEMSLCMIVKDEEANLPACLEGLEKIVDELIIVDTGSTDKTIEVAKQLGAKVVCYSWENDFAKARNIAFSHATKDYILWLDADDRIKLEDRKELVTLKQTLNNRVDMVMMPYYLVNPISNQVEVRYWRERIIKRGLGAKWEGVVHEGIQPQGIIIYKQLPIYHCKPMMERTRRNLNIYEAKRAKGEVLTLREQFYYIRELYEWQQYEEALVYGELYLQEEVSAQEKIETCRIMALCKRERGEEELDILYKTFKYGPPRQDICCEIGNSFLNKKVYKEAIFWYELALQIPINPQDYLFEYEKYLLKVPYEGLIRVYEAMGNTTKIDQYKRKLEMRG